MPPPACRLSRPAGADVRRGRPAASWQARPRSAARAHRLGALVERLAVRAAASSAAADDVVAAARLCAGRSDAEPRHDGNAGAARARTAARSDAGPESLARRRAGRREQAQGRARRPAGRPQGQGRAVQADRAAQATAAATGGAAKAAAATSSAATAAAGRCRRRRRPHRPASRPPPGKLPCNWSGNSGGEGVTRNKHFLGDKPGFVAINYNLYVKPDDIKVIYRGQVLAGTGGPRSGRGGFGFDWKPVAGDYSVDVIVTGEMWGTRWKYAMVCPALRNRDGRRSASRSVNRCNAIARWAWRAIPYGAPPASCARRSPQRLSRKHADLLAIPEVDPTGRRIDWYAPFEGEARKLADLGDSRARAAPGRGPPPAWRASRVSPIRWRRRSAPAPNATSPACCAMR